MHASEAEMTRMTDGLVTKADKIRKLGRAGYPRADIARFLGIRYQHVRNTLEEAGIPLPDRDMNPMQDARDTETEQAFSEEPSPFNAENVDDYFPLHISRDGRLVLPKVLRDAMMLDPDGRVTAHVEDGELRIISPLAAIRHFQRIAQKHKKPGVSVVDELIAERRAEAAREDADA